MYKTYKNSKATIIVNKNTIDRFCIPKLPETCEIAVSGDFLGRQYSDHPRVLRFSYNFLYNRVQFCWNPMISTLRLEIYREPIFQHTSNTGIPRTKLNQKFCTADFGRRPNYCFASRFRTSNWLVPLDSTKSYRCTTGLQTRGFNIVGLTMSSSGRNRANLMKLYTRYIF